MRTVKLTIEGMSCASCAAAVEKALTGLPGVHSAKVDFLSRTATVLLLPTEATVAEFPEQALLRAVKQAGYRARLQRADRAAAGAGWAAGVEWLKLIGIGALLFGGWGLGVAKLVPATVATGLVVAALVLAAWPVCWRALKALRARRLDADVLVAIAVVAAASVGEFVAAAEVAFIMLLGAQLENYTVRRARRSLSGLLSLVPATARVRRGEREQELPAQQLQVGDVVVVRAGERIPADGVVQSGTATVNQAAVTGESMPVEKGPGDEVFVGTLAESGALVLQATRVGEDTTLARIAQIVESAQQRQAPVQRTLDRLAAWLVPVMLALAAGVFVWTRDIERAVTVLIVACPCALVLATPTAVMAAIARAAREGVLIKGGQHLEAAGRLHTIVFDKTGTLTHGRPEVAHVSRFDQHSEAELVEMAAVAEKLSAHPVARAILRKAEALGVRAEDPTRFQALHGRGVVAERNGQKLVVGQKGLMDEHAVRLPEQLDAHVKEHHEEGHTTVVVAHDGTVCGTICVSDTVRARADEAIRQLRRLGIERVVMLTGDNRRVAMKIAGALGIDEVKAEVLPEQKAEQIESLKRTGRAGGGVAMVGDGVNDAPALAVADVGIAMGVSGTDVAHEAAAVALMADDLSKIAFAVGLSRAALRVIRQGLWFALLYNVTLVYTAAAAHIGMIGGAIAHQISSVLVILNAMRLLRYR
jgi:Cd2+/Zn2+-exporting ATPase